MFCNKCGNPVDNGIPFCPKCGNSMGTAPSQSTSVQSPLSNLSIPASALGFFRITSTALFILHLLHYLCGGLVWNNDLGVGSTVPGILVLSGGVFATVLCIIFYSFGILASFLPFASKQLETAVSAQIRDILCKKTYIQIVCLFLAFVFYIVAFAMGAAKSGGYVSFFAIFGLLLQLAHMGMLLLMNKAK